MANYPDQITRIPIRRFGGLLASKWKLVVDFLSGTLSFGDSPMTDRCKSSLAVWLIVGAVLSPIAYLLSFGPFVWLHDQGYLPDPVMWLHMPLIYAYQEYEPARQAIESYVGLFGVQSILVPAFIGVPLRSPKW